MKKFVVAILAVLYLSASIGVAIQFHYCMGNLVGWELSHGDNTKCVKCGMEKDGQEGCCKDEYKQIKNTNDQKTTESVSQLSKISIEIAQTNLPDYSIKLAEISIIKFPKANAPPRSCHTSINILNCVFLI